MEEIMVVCIKQYLIEVKDYGIKVACSNTVFNFCSFLLKTFCGVKNIKVTYRRK